MKRSSTNTRRSDTAITLLLSLAVLGLAAGCNDSGPAQAAPGATQPVQFNHNLHVVEMDLDCPTCHQYVMEGRKATLPNKDLCMECHEEPQGESAEEAKLVGLLNSGEDLDWQRIYVLPKHVYFSHRRHVTLGQIGCQSCHGDMRDCHQEEQAGTDCLDCHN
jgi:hypothetical protein